MSDKLLPCKCGYAGALMGQHEANSFLSLTCPECVSTVDAFTLPGLAAQWSKFNTQKPATQEQAE